MTPIIQAILARLAGANPAFIGGNQIGDAMTEGLNNPQLNAVIAKHLPPVTPNAHVAQGFDQFGPQASQPQAPMLPTPPTPPPVDMGPGALSPQAAAAPAPQVVAPQPIPMPQPRPDDAPSPMSFWQRNAAMMQDPSSGAFIDPSAAADAQQASGPDVIAKLMNYFHNKGNPTD